MSVRKEKRRNRKTGAVWEKYRVDVAVAMPDGSTKRVNRDAPVQTKRDAERFEQDLRRSILDGSFGKKEVKVVPTLAEFEKEFIANYAEANKQEERGADEERRVQEPSRPGVRDEAARRNRRSRDRSLQEPDGSILTKGESKHPLWRACKRAGLRRIGWHVLRHTFASHLVMRKAPIKAVQELMGHSTIAMTERYAHLSPDVRKDAVRLLDRLEPLVHAHMALTSGEAVGK